MYDNLKLIRNKIAHELLEPAGLKLPNIPVKFGKIIPFDLGFSKPNEMSLDIAGHTYFDPVTKRAASIYLNPMLMFDNDILYIAQTIAHELIHSAFKYNYKIPGGHGPSFKKYARAIGLDGPLDATVAGPKFKSWFKQNIEPYLRAQSN